VVGVPVNGRLEIINHNAGLQEFRRRSKRSLYEYIGCVSWSYTGHTFGQFHLPGHRHLQLEGSADSLGHRFGPSDKQRGPSNQREPETDWHGTLR